MVSDQAKGSGLVVVRSHLAHGLHDVEQVALGERLDGEQLRDHLTAVVIGIERPDSLENAVDLRGARRLAPDEGRQRVSGVVIASDGGDRLEDTPVEPPEPSGVRRRSL